MHELTKRQIENVKNNSVGSYLIGGRYLSEQQEKILNATNKAYLREKGKEFKDAFTSPLPDSVINEILDLKEKTLDEEFAEFIKKKYGERFNYVTMGDIKELAQIAKEYKGE